MSDEELMKMALVALKKWPLDTEENSELVSKTIKSLQDRISHQEPEPKPVAYWNARSRKALVLPEDNAKLNDLRHLYEELPVLEALYLKPPQGKEWVGFDEHDFGIWKEPYVGILRWAEATLKDRNGG